MADILENLTPEQRDAVTHMEGPMLVVAGAGSGKTRVVTRRIAYLIERGTWPDQILAMTFTNKAASEMKERVEALVGSQPRWVSTFHSACARFLRRDIETLDDGRTSQYTIYDAQDQLSVVKQCMKELSISSKDLDPRHARQAISSMKCSFEDDAQDASGELSHLIPLVYELYEKRMRSMNAVDFDDLLLLMVRILDSSPALQEVYHTRFRYLLIDEYQDTNRVQYALMKLLTGPAKNVHATGDPDQSIYSWRGAQYRNIMDFTKDFPDAKVINLERNYRSTQHILDAANELISFNTERFEKNLFTDKEQGVPTTVVNTEDGREEAAWVVQRMEELRLEGASLRDMAVFYRTNAQSRVIEDALITAGIAYQILGGLRFFERMEIKDVVAHLRLLVNPMDMVSLERVIGCTANGVGDVAFRRIVAMAGDQRVSPVDILTAEDFVEMYTGRTTAQLLAFAEWCRGLTQIESGSGSVGDVIHKVIEYSGLIEHYTSGGGDGDDPTTMNRLENLDALIDRGYEFDQKRADGTLAGFLEEVALVSDIDSHDSELDCVVLMTLHASKGLEFPYVFIVGVEEGCLPHENSLDSPGGLEEERRLLYVGITRAQEAVYLLNARSRFRWGNTEIRQPSRFIRNLSGVDVSQVDTASAFADWRW